MSADPTPDLASDLIDTLTPEGAPSDDDIVTAGHDPDGETAPQASRIAAWRPDDAGAADWVARKVQRASAAIDDLQAQRDRLVAQADDWLARNRRAHDATVGWASGLLEHWLRQEIDRDDSKRPRQSRELPSGVAVKRTSGRPRLVVDDHDALVDWLTADPDYAALATATWKVDAAAVKKLVTRDGLALTGAHVETGPDTVTVALGGGS